MESSGEIPSVDQEELDAIEAAFAVAESLFKRRRTSPDQNDSDRSNGRRLPKWGTTLAPINRSDGRVQRSSTVDLGSLEKEEKDSVESSNVVATSSSCPRNGRWMFSPPSCNVNLKMRYPAMNFAGRILYSRTYSEVEKAAMEILEIMEAKKQKNSDQISLGFDIEWRPTFRAGEQQRKAAVMQICVDTEHCYVMHIIHSGIPPILQSLLEDSTSVKVGVSIRNDVVKVMKDYNVCIKETEDLSGIANVKLGGIGRQWSLASLTEMVTCKQLEKPNKIRLGNWEAVVLSREQLKYAATDAFASWYLYEVLRRFPDNNQDMQP